MFFTVKYAGILDIALKTRAVQRKFFVPPEKQIQYFGEISSKLNLNCVATQ